MNKANTEGQGMNGSDGDSARTAPPAPTTGGVHPLLADAFRVLDEAGKPWLLLRGADDLVAPTGDVDLLIHPAMKSTLDAAMRAVGFFRVVSAGRGTHRFYFAHDVAAGGWLKLDVVSDVTFGPYQQWTSPLAEGCLRRRTREGLLSRPEPADEAWLHLLHLVLDRAELTQDRVPRAQAAAAAADATSVLARFVDRRLGAGSVEVLLSAVRSGDRALIARASARLRTAWTSTQPIGARVRFFINRAQRFGLPPTVPGRTFRGLTVGVRAPDPTAANALIDTVVEQFPAPTRRLTAPFCRAARVGSPPRTAQVRWLLRGAPGLMNAARSRFHLLRGRLVLFDCSSAATADVADHPPAHRESGLVPNVVVDFDPLAPTGARNGRSGVVDIIWQRFVGVGVDRR